LDIYGTPEACRAGAVEFTLRPEVERSSQVEWSDFESAFSRDLSTIIEAWETHHLSQSLVA